MEMGMKEDVDVADEMSLSRSKRNLAQSVPKWFTHETEKDKTGNIFLGMTKLGKTGLGIWFAENPFCEIPTFMANSKISKYEKSKN